MIRTSRALRAPAFALCLWAVGASAEVEDPDRLSDEVVPTEQWISLRLDPRTPHYRGEVRIALEIKSPVEQFRLHSEEHDIEELTLRSEGREFELSHEAGEADLLVLRSSSALAPGSYELEISFSSPYNLTSRSLYRVEFEDAYYLFTQFESDDARGAFPCWDEPAFKIPWHMRLSAPADQLVIFNTPEAKVEEADGWRTIDFEPTPPMPSYLLAMAVGPFETVEIEGLTVPGRVICPAGKSALAAETVRITPPILAALEEYFDRPYPYAKLDLIAVPEFWPGAMENPGAITFRDTILLLDSESLTVRERSRLTYVMAHELAHQWFGNLVTMQWWDDLWLNESFATWIGQKISDRVHPELGVGLKAVENSVVAMSTDAQVAVQAIRQPVLAGDLKLSEVSLTYDKGSAVLGMFESFIGEDLFRDGVLDYLEKHAWSNASADDLWSSIGETAGMDVSAAMSTFLDQPGVPRVSATPLGDGKIEFRQERSLNYGAELDETPTWRIPVVLRYHDGQQARTHRVLLEEPSQIVELPLSGTPEWIHPNADERGYYRWSLPPDELLAMAEQASARLNVRERMALVGHLSALLDTGELDGGRFLEALGHLTEDPRAEVVDALLGALSKVNVAFVTPEREEAFAAYVRAALGPRAEQDGLSPRPGEPEAVSVLRPKLVHWLGVVGRDPKVVAFAKESTQTFLETKESDDPDLLAACLRVAAVDGDWKLYNRFKAEYESAGVPADRQRYLRALGHFDDRSIATAALRYSLDGPVRPQEMFGVVQGVGTHFGDDGLVWDWFVESYDAMTARLPEMFLSFMPYFAAGCDGERLAAAEIFFADPDHQVAGTMDRLEKVREGVNDCLGLRDREGATVASFLERYAVAQ